MENQRERILIADDEKEIRDILRLLLTQEGYAGCRGGERKGSAGQGG